jgi:hypothetical protein
MLLALLAHDDVESVGLYLDRVADLRTSEAALDCMAADPNPPLEALFQFLRGPQEGRRMAAATVLGRMDNPEISRKLIAMVSRGSYRREAMIALLSSTETTARQYLAGAERDQMLSATLWNAKRQFQNSFLRRNDDAMSNPSS